MFKVLDKVCEPQRATKYSSSVDLFARESVTIGAGETQKIPLGVKIDLEKIKKITPNYNEIVKYYEAMMTKKLHKEDKI